MAQSIATGGTSLSRKTGGWALSAVTTCAMAAGAAHPTYRMTDIGTLGGTHTYVEDLNESGQVTGFSYLADDVIFHAFLWKNDGTPMVDLGSGTSSAKAYSYGIALNDSAEVLGQADSMGNGAHAALWSSNGTHVQSLGTFGGASSTPWDLNDLGQATGNADLSGNGTLGTGIGHAFVWLNNGSALRDLGTLGGDQSGASALNASGQITGTAQIRGSADYHAFLWRNDGTPMTDLGTLGGRGSAGWFINDSGMVVGVAQTATNKNTNHCFLWRNDGSPMVDLGTFGGLDVWPTAMNNAGQVVGYSTLSPKSSTRFHAFVWRNDGTPMLNLGTFVRFSANSSAGDINASGWVTGSATSTDGPHAFLWKNDGKRIQDLNGLVDPADPLKAYVTLTAGSKINDAGDIVAQGIDSRTFLTHAYFLRGSSLALAPRSLAFGNQAVGSASGSQPVTVQNNTNAVVAITSIRRRGADANQFSSTNNCGSSLIGKASCTIKVTFNPTSKGAKSAMLVVNGGGGGLRTVTLTGTGT